MLKTHYTNVNILRTYDILNGIDFCFFFVNKGSDPGLKNLQELAYASPFWMAATLS